MLNGGYITIRIIDAVLCNSFPTIVAVIVINLIFEINRLQYSYFYSISL